MRWPLLYEVHARNVGVGGNLVRKVFLIGLYYRPVPAIRGGRREPTATIRATRRRFRAEATLYASPAVLGAKTRGNAFGRM